MSFKKIILILLLISVMVVFVSCGDPEIEPCTSHADTDNNGTCDKCGAAVEPEKTPCATHTDTDGDKKCDVCSAAIEPEKTPCTTHTDTDGDKKCDSCGAAVEEENQNPPCSVHTDIKNDGTCDKCGTKFNDGKLQYTVYIKDVDGNPIKNVKLMFSVGQNLGDIPSNDYASDENGMFTTRLQNKNKDVVKVIVYEAPETYEYTPEPNAFVASFEADSYETDLILAERVYSTDYTITVIKKNTGESSSSPVAGAEIKIYSGEMLIKTLTTDENGKVSFAFSGDSSSLRIEVGYTADGLIPPKDPTTFPEGETEATIILKESVDLPIMPF